MEEIPGEREMDEGKRKGGSRRGVVPAGHLYTPLLVVPWKRGSCRMEWVRRKHSSSLRFWAKFGLDFNINTFSCSPSSPPLSYCRSINSLFTKILQVLFTQLCTRNLTTKHPFLRHCTTLQVSQKRST